MEWGLGWVKRLQASLNSDTPPPSPMRVIFSADQAAATLWIFGEEYLVDAARRIDERTLRSLWTLAGRNYLSGEQLPLSTRFATDKVIALTCVEYFEGRMRPLAHERRRSRSRMPRDLREAKAVPPATSV